ncbi:hypothetical protein MPSEU_000003900 [Mayamaea pseudoterrestris]|nr:hypothetical protein MPSEU_000003900 [Mayamaea pseudoterrestris]
MAKDKSELASSAACSSGLQALMEHDVTAQVKDLDHYRTHKGMYVETDYIVEVASPKYFEPFFISKTYSQFRALVNELKEIADAFASLNRREQQDSSSLAKTCNLSWHLIESQPTEYLGKVSYSYVKNLAKQRKTVVDDVLSQLLEQFPSSIDNSEFFQAVGNCIEVFFLTDHCEPDQRMKKKVLTADTISNRSLGRNKTNSSKQVAATMSIEGEQQSSKSIWKALDKNFLGKGLLKVGNGLGSGISTVTSGVGSGLTTVTSGVGTVVKRMDISNAFCANATANNETFTSPVRTRKEGAGGVSNSKLIPMTTKDRHTLEALDSAGDNGGEVTCVMEESLEVVAAAAEDFASPNPKLATPIVGSAKLNRLRSSRFNRQGFVENKSFLIALGVVILAVYMRFRSQLGGLFSIDGDVALLLSVITFFLGQRSPSSTILQPAPQLVEQQVDKTRAMLARTCLFAPMSPLRRSSIKVDMLQAAMVDDEIVEEEIGQVLDSPLPQFPKGAKIGSHNNCWSVPEHESFLVRGPKYLVDRKKVASEPFLFPTRGMDLFLTDTCPENVGSLTCVFGGHLRTVPTLIINFRLPWGVLIFYFEIPAKFVPFLRACYEPDFDQSELCNLDSMTPAERTVCRFLQSDLANKNKTLKIVPVVVDGPWIVKNVVGGKPAIIGTKLPVSYVYQPPTEHKALYLEADLDIAASSAARGILSVTRSYTEILTIDIGFVVQANAIDELPERMLCGCRIHGVDPLTAQQLPLQSSTLAAMQHDSDDNESLSGLELCV